MEPGPSRISSPSVINFDADRVVEQRLARLLELNTEVARQRALYRTDRERLEASLMRSPIDSRKFYSYFGFMIGLMPPASLAVKIVLTENPQTPTHALFIALLFVASAVTGFVGYASGKIVPRLLGSVSDLRFPNKIAMISLIGLLWGGMSGAAGGLFILIIGAIPGSIAGGVIGALALPLLALFHQALRRGDMIEMKHFLPFAFGITLSLCALILGA